MQWYTQRGCLGKFLLFPFFLTFIVIYISFLLCKSFLTAVFIFLWELIKLIAKSFKRGKPPLTGIEYEEFVAGYLRSHGYLGVKKTPASKDYGVDLTAYKGCKKYAFQCKYYAQPVGVAAVQEVVAGMAYYKCSKAVVVTNSTFTASAQTLAAQNNVLLLASIAPHTAPAKKKRTNSPDISTPFEDDVPVKISTPLKGADVADYRIVLKALEDTEFDLPIDFLHFICQTERVLTSAVQRKLKWGYARTAEMLDVLVEKELLLYSPPGYLWTEKAKAPHES